MAICSSDERLPSSWLKCSRVDWFDEAQPVALQRLARDAPHRRKMKQICLGTEDSTGSNRSGRHERLDAVIPLPPAAEIVNAMSHATRRAEFIDQFELDAGWTE